LLDAKLIIAGTWSGYTARRVARVRPNTPILAATPNRQTYNRLALVWGVLPMLVEEFGTIDEMIGVVQKRRGCGAGRAGRLIVVIGGVPFGMGSQTNFLRVSASKRANCVTLIEAAYNILAPSIVVALSFYRSEIRSIDQLITTAIYPPSRRWCWKVWRIQLKRDRPGSGLRGGRDVV
jgi:hypothetical protein